MWTLLVLLGASSPLFTEASEAFRNGSVENAKALFEQGCAASDAASCAALGDLATQDPQGDPGMWWGKACTLGVAYACGNLGILAAQVSDWAEAERLLGQGCDLGDGHACHTLGALSLEGHLGAPDLARVEPLFRKSCDLDYGPGCHDAGILSEGSAPSEALGLYARGCRLGNASSCGQAGYLRGMPAGGSELELGCLGKDARACAILATAYDEGWQGHPADLAAGAVAWQIACDLRAWAACNILGRRNEEGQGVPEDTFMAISLYQRSCDGDDAAGCVFLGSILVELDPFKALRAFSKGCGLGDNNGCYKQATLLLDGTGMSKDEARAAELLEASCAKQHRESCETLAGLYNNGIGVKKDKEKAAMLYQQALQLKTSTPD